MKLEVPVEGGEPIQFECGENWVSRWVARSILEDKTYPVMPFVSDVQVVVDAGANCGATTVHFARHYPQAQIHAVEPGSAQLKLLERNTASLPNVRVHPVGLHATEQEVPLYAGVADTITASVFRRSVNAEASEVITLRNAGAWADEHGIGRIDVLKVDVEGCEADVLESLAPLLPTVRVLYVEYDGREQRRRIYRLLDETHDFYFGEFMMLDQGECIFLDRATAALDEATQFLAERFRRDA